MLSLGELKLRGRKKRSKVIWWTARAEKTAQQLPSCPVLGLIIQTLVCQL